MRLLGNSVVVVFVVAVLGLPEVSAQSTKSRPKTAEYDYKSLALASIRESVQDAKKLTDIIHKIRFLLEASTQLSDSSKKEAIEVLDLALAEIKDWESKADPPGSGRFLRSYLRNQVLAQYLKLNPDKANQLIAEEISTSTDTDFKPLQKNSSWNTTLNERWDAAEKAIAFGMQLIESDPERATALLATSVMKGVVSLELNHVFNQLRSNRSRLVAVHERLAASLRTTVAIDQHSVLSASILTYSDMSPSVRSAFVQFLIRSLEAWVNLSHATVSEGGLDRGYLDSMFGSFASNARPVIAQHDPNELGRFDVLLDQVAPQVSTRIKEMVAQNATVELDDPRARLNDIKKEVSPSKRDSRLLNLSFHLLRNDMRQNEEDLLTDAVQAITDEKLKSTLNDFVSLDRVHRLTKAQNISDAIKAIEHLTNANLKAFALLAISSVVVADDRFQAMTLVNAAVQTLDTAAPTPRRVEIALLGVAVTAQTDPNRAMEILSLVPKYANAVENKDESSRNALSGLVDEVSIGAIKLSPFRPPEQLSDIQFEPSIQLLAKRDWFGLQKIADSVKDPVLSLSFKLELAKGALKKSFNKPTPAATSP